MKLPDLKPARLACIVFAVLAAIVAVPAVLHPQGQTRSSAVTPALAKATPANERVNPLVVRVDGARLGAGLIVALDSKEFIIASCRHLLKAPVKKGDTVNVAFIWTRTQTAKATVRLVDETDLMYLAVDRNQPAASINADALPLDLLGSPKKLTRGSDVHALGHAGGTEWFQRVTPEKVNTIDDRLITFDSNFATTAGYSGGPLLDADFKIVGMIVAERSDNLGAALPITQVVPDLSKEGYQMLGRAAGVRFRSLSVGAKQYCAVSVSDVLYCAGSRENPFETTLQLKPGTSGTVLRVASISAGGTHVCGFGTNGGAFCSGKNDLGQLGDEQAREGAVIAPAGKHDFVQIASGGDHTCGLLSSGQAFCWGGNDSGQIGDGTRITRAAPTAVAGDWRFARIAAGGRHTCGVTSDNKKVVCWGAIRPYGTDLKPLPTEVLNLKSEWLSLVLGDQARACLLFKDGVAECWGPSVKGETGNPKSGTIRRIPGGHQFTSISIWDDHACGLEVDGHAWCWGDNSSGQLGDGSKKDSTEPKMVVNQRFSQIGVGRTHTCGLTGGPRPFPDPNGTRAGEAVYCWGSIPFDTVNATHGGDPSKGPVQVRFAVPEIKWPPPVSR